MAQANPKAAAGSEPVASSSPAPVADPKALTIVDAPVLTVKQIAAKMARPQTAAKKTTKLPNGTVIEDR